jgi:hypothetical protein
MVSKKDGSRDDIQEGTIKREAEQASHRGERGISPERWEESERADADADALTRAGREARQPSGRESTGGAQAERAEDRRVEAQAEVGRRAAESGDAAPRRQK